MGPGKLFPSVMKEKVLFSIEVKKVVKPNRKIDSTVIWGEKEKA